MVDGYLIHRNLSHKASKAKPICTRKDNALPYKTLSGPDEGNCSGLGIITQKSNITTLLTKQGNDGIYDMLCELKFNHPDAEVKPGVNRGFTWVELVVLAILRGRYQPLAKKRPSDKGISASIQIGTFKKKVRALANKLHWDDQYKDVLKPAKHTRDVLAGIGIKGQQPSLRANVYCSPAEQEEVARALVSLSRRITLKNVEGFLQWKISYCSL